VDDRTPAGPEGWSLEGLGLTSLQVSALEERGVSSQAALRTALDDPGGRKEIAETLALDRKEVEELDERLHVAQLSGDPAVGRALIAAGLDDLARIARTLADELVELVPTLDPREAQNVKDKATELAFPLGWRPPDRAD
jgi:hypothetical protein